MKKLIPRIVLFIAFLFATVSCSGDDDNSGSTNLVLIKKVTETIYLYDNAPQVYNYDFFYEGTTLKAEKYGSSTININYDGDKITTMELLNGDNELRALTTYYYTGNVLSYSISGKDYLEKINYSFQNGGLSKVTFGDFTDGNFKLARTEVFTLDNSLNTTQRTVTYPDDVQDTGYKQVYTFDNKNNPMLNTNKYYRIGSRFEGFSGADRNNVLTRKTYSLSGELLHTYTYEHIYNEDGFPTEIKQYSEQGLLTLTTIEYQ